MLRYWAALTAPHHFSATTTACSGAGPHSPLCVVLVQQQHHLAVLARTHRSASFWGSNNSMSRYWAALTAPHHFSAATTACSGAEPHSPLRTVLV
ncbi:hypothetical protein Y032_0227g2812 [Ancylostoma ceylanicum]|uniref:Uncharacterized protein n=1 Tax=Ancylostoma ceylanicum TaxID=53326 RepID=A0A016SGS2_9BILA|nr:hypothetical protein Y032_0227g2812 [Ancylostoma ceylanicum]